MLSKMKKNNVWLFSADLATIALHNGIIFHQYVAGNWWGGSEHASILDFTQLVKALHYFYERALKLKTQDLPHKYIAVLESHNKAYIYYDWHERSGQSSLIRGSTGNAKYWPQFLS